MEEPKKKPLEEMTIPGRREIHISTKMIHFNAKIISRGGKKRSRLWHLPHTGAGQKYIVNMTGR